MWTVASDGTLTAVSGSPFTTGTLPTAIAVDPGSAFVYVTTSGDNKVAVFTIDNTNNKLVSAGSVSTGTGPSSIVTTQ